MLCIALEDNKIVRKDNLDKGLRKCQKCFYICTSLTFPICYENIYKMCSNPILTFIFNNASETESELNMEKIKY